MFSLVSSFVVAIATSLIPTDSVLITSPPKLELESERIVWYQVSTGGSAQKFELECQASGDPEKYEWYKDGESMMVDNARIVWQRPGQSGTIVIYQPKSSDQGFYQCHAINIFGVAVSNIFEVRLGALDHFSSGPMRQVVVRQGDSLMLPCKLPFGEPEPSIFWLFRNIKESFVIESINQPHITVDGEGNLRFSYVDLHDGRENLFYQCAATSPVLHGEYRSGDEFRLIVHPGHLEPRAPTKAWFSPSEVRVMANQHLRLTCIFDGYPLPEVKWSKRRGSLPTNRLFFENFGKTLIIKPIYASDEGVYICEAGNIKHRMSVFITTAPQWIDGPPRDFDLPEEANVEMKCRAAGDPTPVVRWFKNGKPLEESNGRNQLDESRTTVLHNGEILRITDLQHKIDRGVYQCNASNPLGYIFANAYLNVRAHAPVFDFHIDQTIKVVLGATVELDCTVRAAPLPKVRWVDEENHRIKQVEGKLEILKSHSLRIHTVTFLDAGVFYCNVSNKFGINKARRQLEVYKGTTFLSTLKPKLRILEPNDKIELQCEAEADSRLEIQYIWSRDDVVINFLADLLIQRSQDEPNKINIIAAKGRHSGIYKCTAKTDVDEISTTMQLIVKDVPDAPMITDIICKDTNAEIRWMPAYDNHASIEAYFLEYSTGFQPNVWKTELALPLLNNETEGYSGEVRMSPWVNYTFRVVAENWYGRGIPGYRVNVGCTTEPSFPYDNPKDVAASGTIKDNLVVRWKPMEKELWNAPGLFYIVRYRIEENADENWSERRIEDPFLDHTEIRDLPTFKRFQVQVKALNSIGPSLEEPPIILGYSGEDVPYAVVSNFRVGEMNATFVQFAWNPVDQLLMNGHLQGYRIKTWQIISRHVNVTLPEVEVTPFPTVAIVDHFEPVTSYGAQIFALNTHFEGPSTTSIKFTTPEGIPDAVENLTAEAYGANSVLLTWLDPIRIRGTLRVFHIEFFEESEEIANETIRRSEKVYATVVPSDKNYHLFDAAQSLRNYTLFVWGETGGGHGKKASAIVQTFNETYPSKPSFELEVLDMKSYRITWIPNKTGLPGNSFHVNYTILDSLIWLKSPTVSIPRTSVVIDNLISDVDYKFVVYAKEGDRATPSRVKFARIISNRTLADSSSRAEASLRGAAWFIAIICVVGVSLLSLLVICICHRTRGGKYSVKEKEVERGGDIAEKEEMLLGNSG